jgi:anti-sigma regulatory factor (Ser/Thr protein kinase)
MTNAFRMTVGTGAGEIAQVNAAFARFAAERALPAAVRRSVQIALDELLSNAIGYGGARTADVAVGLASDRIEVMLADDGRPFDPFGATAPPPDTSLPIEERPLGGLGIHLVRELMDEVSYARRDDRNVVVLTKFLSGG